jgi:hypothetical protein
VVAYTSVVRVRMMPAVGTPTMGVNVKCGYYAGVGGVVDILARADANGGHARDGQ